MEQWNKEFDADPRSNQCQRNSNQTTMASKGNFEMTEDESNQIAGPAKKTKNQVYIRDFRKTFFLSFVFGLILINPSTSTFPDISNQRDRIGFSKLIEQYLNPVSR